MFTMTMPDIIDEMMVEQFETVQTMDYNVSFTTPVLKSAERDMRYELSGSSYVEGRIEYPFEISVGNKSKTVIIIGITVSYTHLRAHETDSYLVCRLLL